MSAMSFFSWFSSLTFSTLVSAVFLNDTVDFVLVPDQARVGFSRELSGVFVIFLEGSCACRRPILLSGEAVNLGAHGGGCGSRLAFMLALIG